MEISIADQIALDDALVAPADRLKIGKCNLRLSSDVTSKEATLQVVYDVLKLTPFYKAFQVTADAPEIYMQEFWASAYVHNRSVRFKMNNKKHILGLDQFRDILQICPKVGNKKFEEPPLEKEILAFLASLGHSGEIRKITDDVNVNKLHQPWRSFAAIINKCLSGKTSYDSLRLSQAQILWGMYNNKKVDYAYLLWEDFIYQIENKNTKKGNAMYYPRFTKLIVNFVMAKDPSIPRRNKVNWHYARDDPMFTTINVISRNEDTQLYGTILPAELTNEDIRNSESYKEYYAIASGKIPPKTKASKKKANSDATTKQKPSTSSSVSSGFVSNMLNPNQDTGVDAIFGHKSEATSLIDILVTAIAEPSFFAPTNRPPTPTPLFIQLQQPPILTPATIPSSSLQNLPDFAIDVAVQLKYDKIREESHTENQQFLDSIDEGMKKVIKEQVKKEVLKITLKIEKLVNEQLESEVLVLSGHQRKPRRLML
ncbi:hypothetical protein Tco_0735378 [Tanacetum coccineum]